MLIPVRTSALWLVCCGLGLHGVVPAQGALLRKQGDLWQVPIEGRGLRAAVTTLLLGPTAAQRRQGITSAVPRNMVLVALQPRGGKVHITLGAGFLSLLAKPARLEDAI